MSLVLELAVSTLGEVERRTFHAPFGTVHLQGVPHRLAVVFGEVGVAGDPVKVRCPLKFIGSGTEAGFVEKATADVVTDVRLVFR